MSIAQPWARDAADVVAELQSDDDSGLSEAEARSRLEKHGPNQIAEAQLRNPLRVFLGQFADLMIGLLAVAAVISAVIGDWTDAILIAIIVLANAVIGFVQEWRAERAVAALKSLSRPHAHVIRGGSVREITSDGVVPGDLLELKAGEFVPADARLLSTADFEVDEAPLTGESLPVEKVTGASTGEAALPDRTCMVYSGTSVVRGNARAVVTATGMSTELGNIAELLTTAENVQTPLQRRLAHLSRRLALVVLAVSVVIFAAGILRVDSSEWNSELVTVMLLTAVSLAVAAIPEGLPAVITVTLALGSQRMARRNAIVRRLSAVETLGSVDVICSDKTGTLTQNRMAVADVVPADDAPETRRQLLEAAVLCNDAALDADGDVAGSATESALLQMAIDEGCDPGELRETHPRLDEIPFSSDRKRMTTLHASDNGNRLFVKGAFERVLPLCEAEQAAWGNRVDELAEQGRRVIAFATREWPGDRLPDDEGDAEPDLHAGTPLLSQKRRGGPYRLLGVVGIVDPPRPEAAQAIARCRSAGIRPVMITGDHPGTAKAIAEELSLWQEGDGILSGTDLDGLTDEQLAEQATTTAVYARVSPEHKLRIVRAHQSHDSVTSMTGDGVNDAPALKQADIGVAMGITGTDVAKESSEMVLADDNFATIVAAVEEGRVVYDNIRKFVAYLLTANTGEVLLLFIAILLGAPLPLLPVHILWVNLVTDGLPALALGFEPAEQNIMQRKPRSRSESLFAGGLAWGIVLVGTLMAVCCYAVFTWLLGDGGYGTHTPDVDAKTLKYAMTQAFVVLSLAQLFYVLAVRSSSESFFRLGLWSNYRLTGAVVIGIALQLAVVYVPELQTFFHTVPLSGADLAIGIVASLPAFVVVEAWKFLKRVRPG